MCASVCCTGVTGRVTPACALAVSRANNACMRAEEPPLRGGGRVLARWMQGAEGDIPMTARIGTPVLSILLALVVHPSSGTAQETSLDALLAELKQASPTVSAARARAAAADAARRAAGRPDDPMLDVEVDNLGLREEDDRMMVRYALQQPIPTVGTLRMQRNVAGAMAEQAEHGARGALVDVTFQGARAFVMLRMSQGELANNERQQRLVELVRDSALARMQAGADSHHDVLQSQAELLMLRNQHTLLEARIVEGRAMINALRNRPPDTPIVAGEAWPAAASLRPTPRLEEEALQRRPELSQMQAMQREQRAMGELMQREARPMFRVGAWYNDMLMMGDSMGVMVSASLPVFGVPRQRARAESARRAAEAAGRDVVAMAAMIRAQIHSAAARYQAALARERLLRDVLIQKAEETLMQAQTAYRSGMMAYASVVQDRRMLAEAQMELIEAEADRVLAMAELLRAVGAAEIAEVLP